MKSDTCDNNCIECEAEFKCKKHLTDIGMEFLLIGDGE